jgi:hypothetical protein
VSSADVALDQAAEARVCSSRMDTILIGRPSVVASNRKSTAHTTFGASAVGAKTSASSAALTAAEDRLAA